MTQITLPNQSVTGTNLWSQVEDNDQAIVDVVNGDIGTDNIQTGLLPPTGSLMPYAGSTAPTGWLLCDGSVVSQTTYDDLYAVISTTYNTSGEGAGNFRLPNLKGKTIVGRDSADSDFNDLGETQGTKTHTLTTSEIPAHNHSVTDPGHTHTGTVLDKFEKDGSGFTSFTGIDLITSYYSFDQPDTPDISINSNTTGITIGNTGGGGSHNNIQPSIVLNYIIKT